ncbi:MAG: metal ABC transporter permease [Candidatus Dormibacteria bacterium]
MEQPLSFDLLRDLQLLLEFHFMQNAAVVATMVALLAGAVGYFVVLRGQAFAAHMLSQVGFPGAAGAALLHLSPVVGLLTFCTVAGVGISASGGRLATGRRTQSAAIGTILAFSLALGLLFSRLSADSSQGIYAFLFGTILGITDTDVRIVLATTLLCLGALAVICRPLLFASIDPVAADARRVPVRALGVAIMLVTAVAVAEAVQVVGTLLIFALLVAPAAAAQRVTARPYAGIALSMAISLTVTWAGLATAYFSNYPVGFFISMFAFAVYLTARLRARA